VHHQGAFAYGQHVLGIITIQGYDTRFIDHYFVVVYNQGIGGTQVHGYFLRKEIE
jgi:hypothetical protein